MTKKFEIYATVTVEVIMTVTAETEPEARELFTDQLAMNATLVDVAEYMTIEDTITDIRIEGVEAET